MDEVRRRRIEQVLNRRRNEDGDSDSEAVLNYDEIRNMENHYLALLPGLFPRYEIALEIYNSCFIFGIFMCYQLMSFFMLLSIGLSFYHFLALLSESGLTIFAYSPTYYIVIYICVFLKLFQDYLECEYFGNELNHYTRDNPTFRNIYSGVTILLAIISYGLLFKYFYIKGYNYGIADPSWYLLAVSYIHYFNIVRCIQNSENTILLHQIIQNFLNVKFGIVVLRFGGICGSLFFLENFPILIIPHLLSIVTILMTLGYLALHKVAFKNLGLSGGTKWAEVFWSVLCMDFLLKCYLNMTSFDEIQSSGIHFHVGVAYFLFLTTKVVAAEFVKLTV